MLRLARLGGLSVQMGCVLRRQNIVDIAQARSFVSCSAQPTVSPIKRAAF